MVYSFPSRSKCPRCHSLDTLRVSGGPQNQSRVQYRRCQVPICSHAYKVVGKPIEGIPPARRAQ